MVKIISRMFGMPRRAAREPMTPDVLLTNVFIGLVIGGLVLFTLIGVLLQAMGLR